MDNQFHILVVEDTPVAQVVVESQLVNVGCIVDLAADGKSALEKAAATHYDLILMDIGLGEGLDGFEVALLIKEGNGINKMTAIMAVTAHGEPEFNKKAESVGMVGYFIKPFRPIDAEKIIDYLKNN